MRTKEGRSKIKQTTRQSNTAHPNPRHSTLYAEHSTTELPRQLSWLGPNLTSHSTPDEQANHQLSMCTIQCTSTGYSPMIMATIEIHTHVVICKCTVYQARGSEYVCRGKINKSTRSNRKFKLIDNLTYFLYMKCIIMLLYTTICVQ